MADESEHLQLTEMRRRFVQTRDFIHDIAKRTCNSNVVLAY